MQESNSSWPRKTVLVVDDDEICRCVTSEILENLGVTVHHAADAGRAICLAKANHYDLILLDLYMPSMNGIDLARILQESGAAAEDRIFLLTGEEPEAVLKKIQAGNTLRIFHKPLERTQIMSFFSTQKNGELPEAATVHTVKIKGFDISLALANFLGNESVFFSILREFPRYGATFISDYSSYLKAKNIKECLRLAHSLKGSSLMIGATEINRVAKELESACYSASDVQRIEEAYKKIEAKILEASKNVKNHFQQHGNA